MGDTRILLKDSKNFTGDSEKGSSMWTFWTWTCGIKTYWDKIESRQYKSHPDI